MNAADIVVMPSVSSAVWSEQYGRVAPEAMACGRVVVVSTSGALPEVVGNAAVVVPEGDADRLVETLRELYHNEVMRRTIGPRAAEHAAANHSLLVQVDRMEHAFRPWLDRSGSTSTRQASP
jgi:glycosyltransferase involved in cell wall biosynthesis